MAVPVILNSLLCRQNSVLFPPRNVTWPKQASHLSVEIAVAVSCGLCIYGQLAREGSNSHTAKERTATKKQGQKSTIGGNGCKKNPLAATVSANGSGGVGHRW